MTQGQRIRFIRKQRKMTQKQLGELCGFSSSTADVRIRQYESNQISPKHDTLLKIANALNVNYIAIKNYDLGSAEDILETLFWLDSGDNTTIDLFQLERKVERKADWKFKGSYNDYNYMQAGDPFAIVINYGLVNEFMEEWWMRKCELARGEISPGQYNNWKWNWPYSCDEGKNGENYVDWKILT